MSWNSWQKMVGGLAKQGEDIGTALKIWSHRAVMRAKFGDYWSAMLLDAA